jgi:hypothetical protein
VASLAGTFGRIVNLTERTLLFIYEPFQQPADNWFGQMQMVHPNAARWIAECKLKLNYHRKWSVLTTKSNELEDVPNFDEVEHICEWYEFERICFDPKRLTYIYITVERSSSGRPDDVLTITFNDVPFIERRVSPGDIPGIDLADDRDYERLLDHSNKIKAQLRILIQESLDDVLLMDLIRIILDYRSSYWNPLRFCITYPGYLREISFL